MFGRKPQDIELNYSFTRDLMDNNYRSALMVSLDRKNYEKRIEDFCAKYQAQLLGVDVKGLVEDMTVLASKRGKLTGSSRYDIGLYLIYYILPAIELSETEGSEERIRSIVEEWRNVANTPEFDYKGINMIKEGFQTTIMGIPLEVFGGKKKSEK